jgi:hypothetical protein
MKERLKRIHMNKASRCFRIYLDDQVKEHTDK